MKKLLSVIMAFALAVSVLATVCMAEDAAYDETLDANTPLEQLPADASVLKEGKLELASKSAILMEVNTGQILYEDNADERLAPASVTKVMSLLLIMEAIDSNKLTLDTKVSASEHAASMGGSQIWLKPNEVMTVHELLKATVIASANDATVALAEQVYGSEETFVLKMNERAKQLGLQNTHFDNCTGLDGDSHYMSAHDIAVISCELLKHKTICKYTTVWMDSLRDGKSELTNTNKLVRYYEGCTGLKTGTTSKAGCCLSASAARDGLELVAVVMGSNTSNDRFNSARKMLDYGFANYEFVTVAGDIYNNDTVKIGKGMKNYCKAIASEDLYLLLPKGATDSIKQTVCYNKSLTAPIKKGSEVGSITVAVANEQAGVIKLVAAENIKKKTVFRSFITLLSALFM